MGPESETVEDESRKFADLVVNAFLRKIKMVLLEAILNQSYRNGH